MCFLNIYISTTFDDDLSQQIMFVVKFIEAIRLQCCWGVGHEFALVTLYKSQRERGLTHARSPCFRSSTSSNRSCFGQHEFFMVMAWKFVIYWSENGSDVWLCGMSMHLWSNVWVCRQFSLRLSCLIHIYINITEIYHCRNFASVRGSFRRSRFFCSCGTRSTLRVHLTSFAVVGVSPEWIASKPPSRLLKVKAVIESVS